MLATPSLLPPDPPPCSLLHVAPSCHGSDGRSLRPPRDTRSIGSCAGTTPSRHPVRIPRDSCHDVPGRSPLEAGGAITTLCLGSRRGRRHGGGRCGCPFRHLDSPAARRDRSLLLVYAVVDDSLSPTFRSATRQRSTSAARTPSASSRRCEATSPSSRSICGSRSGSSRRAGGTNGCYHGRKGSDQASDTVAASRRHHT